MAQVYISSTYRDLREEREAVRRAITRLGHQPVMMEHYGADARTALERCTRDVASCDLYVLLVAWRYGWRPSGDRSITELEWEAAKKADRKRHVYLKSGAEPVPDPSDPNAQADRELAREFRNRLSSGSESMVGSFAAIDELKEHIFADTSALLGRLSGFPKLARVSCNRDDHVRKVKRPWIQGAAQSPPRAGPIVALVHGTPEQGQFLFAERVASCELVELAKYKAGAPVLTTPVDFRWSRESDPAAFVDDMRFEFLSKLSSGNARGIWPAEYYVTTNTPLTVAVEVTPDNWRAKSKLVEAYAKSWFEPPFDRITAPTIVIVYALSADKAVAASFKKIADKLAKLSMRVFDIRLDDVEVDHARAWARLPVVEAISRELQRHVEELFAKKDKWEMETLMNELEDAALRATARGRP